MTTTHVRAADTYARRLQQDGDGRALLATTRRLIADRTGSAYTAALGQPYGGWTDGQVAAYARVHHLIVSGAVQELTVPVDATPGRDSDRAGNQRKLTAGLPPEFTAEVYDGTSHDGDGRLSWPADLVMPWTDGYGNQAAAPLCDWQSTAALEIGHTDASRTFLHLLDGGIVARWPYRSPDVWLLYFPTFGGWSSFRQQSLGATAA